MNIMITLAIEFSPDCQTRPAFEFRICDLTLKSSSCPHVMVCRSIAGDNIQVRKAICLEERFALNRSARLGARELLSIGKCSMLPAHLHAGPNRVRTASRLPPISNLERSSGGIYGRETPVLLKVII